MSGIIVYGPAASTYVWSVRMALSEKGVPYDLVDVPFGSQRSAPHLSRQPFAKVPAFAHDGFCLYETQAILRYIDDVFTEPRLQPGDPRARARMNQQMGILDSYGWPSIAGAILFNRLIAPLLKLPVDDAAVSAALPRAGVCLSEWERLMDDGPFLAGDSFSLADILVSPLLYYFEGIDEGRAALEPHPILTS